ncbi:2-hydroxyacid dehydrogenase [Fredinandcohnia sp. 179-A 10B2 NHS]|uniref:2-hydroxyacid dehydrogenase n=1 Tax=Fredinandcohnia sp. 179-A 10B2 NHS TaxID=3235176 RepID=UPI0039A04362
MMKPYVFITRKLSKEAIKPLEAVAEVHMWPEDEVAVPREVLMEEAKKADGILTMLSDKIDKELIDNAPNLKVIANLAVGFDNIDVEYATEKGIAVCNTPDVLTDTTADLTFALLLATARRIVEAAEFVKEGNWKSWSPLLLAGHDVHHKTLGIVGMGKIGEAVAKRALGFDMEVLYHNRSRKIETEEKLGVVYTSFEDLLEASDFIICLTPLTEQTKNLFTAESFTKMKKSAVFINVSRGPVVDETALYEALVNGEIAAAGLDVFVKEPIEKSHPLVTLPNVVALPHIGSSSTETRTIMMQLCANNIKLVLESQEPETLVNKEWLLCKN